MKPNFTMWRTALWRLVKIRDKKEWDRLDIVSKWLIATRSAVTTVTVYSCMIAGILAWRAGVFSFLPWATVTLGLFIAHGANNLLNDYTDYNRGIDVDNYFRTQYGAHPLVNGFWTKGQQLRWFFASGVLAVLAGFYALAYTGFDPVVMSLFAIGAAVLLSYTYPLKHFALGELSILLIWGPIMIGGVYYVLARSWDWNVALAGVPFGVSVASINLGKHIDKLEMDKAKGVRTLPVIIGEKAARFTDASALVLAYAVVIYLVFVARYFTPVMLIVLIAGKRAMLALRVLRKPRPAEPPKDFNAWPTWFSAFTFYHNRLFGMLLIIGLASDALLQVLLPRLVNGLWPI